MIKNNDPEDIDDFFDNHFANLPKFNESENRDKILLNNLLSKIDEKRNAKDLTFKKEKFSDKLKFFISDIPFMSPKYIVGIPLLLILILSILIINVLKYKENTDIPTYSYPENNTEIHNELPKENDLVVDNSNVEPENTIILGNINYDYSVRGNSQTEFNNIHIKVKQVIEEFLNTYKINYASNIDKIETEWLIENNKNVKLVFMINEINKDIKLQLIQKDSKSPQNLKNINSLEIKNSLEDKIFKHFNSIE